MNSATPALPDIAFDPRLDLHFERIVDIAPKAVWAAWTTPELITQWFTPAPWTTTECEIDLRPGGLFRTLMRSPEGQTFPNVGCYLEVLPERRLAWTSALGPDFRPADLPADGLAITAIIALAPHGQGGTRYTAVARHQNEAGRLRHEAMGFEQGWGKALDQLVALIKRLGPA
jgi:uncharacterized protein YndB with AHSA1/START domain